MESQLQIYRNIGYQTIIISAETGKNMEKLSALLGDGNGQVNLQSMQCDVNLNLRANNEKYQEFVLPLRFFDNCYSPQYEVRFDKDLRNQIKHLIKRKLGQ